MLWSALRWPVNLLEAILAIVVILAIGAAIAVSAFWLLRRMAAKLAGVPLEEEPEQDEAAGGVARDFAPLQHDESGSEKKQ